MTTDRTKKPSTGSEQDSPRATSGGGLGQGREMAAGMPDKAKKKEGDSEENGGMVPGKGNAMPHIPDRIDAPADRGPSRKPNNDDRIEDDGGLAEDDPDGETRA